MYTAIRAKVPLVAVNVQGSHPYDYAKAAVFLLDLDKSLEAVYPGACRRGGTRSRGAGAGKRTADG